MHNLVNIELFISKNKYLVYMLIILVFLLFFYLLYIILFSRKNNTKVKFYLSGKNNIRLFAIYYKEDYIYVVDKKNFKGKKRENLDWFYNSLIKEDAIKANIWINEIIKNDKLNNEALPVQVIIKKQKKPIYSIMNCTSVDRNKGVIHIESRLFPNFKISKNHLLKLSEKQKKYSRLSKIYEEKKDAKNKCKLYYIRLFNSNGMVKTSKWTKQILITMIISKIKFYFSKNIRFCLSSSNNIIVLDTSRKNQDKAINFAKKISKEISKIFLLNGLQNLYNFHIGIVTNKKGQDFNSLVSSAKALTYNDQFEANHISFNQSNNPSSNLEKFKDEIINIIENQNREIDIEYQTIVGSDSGHIKGYYSIPTVKSSLYQDYYSLLDSAYEYQLLEKLLVSLYQRINSVFINKYFITGEQRILFMNIKPIYYQEVIKVVNTTKLPINVKTVFVISDKEIYKESISNSKFLKEALIELRRNKDLFLGLDFSSTSIEISDDVLSQFDYFIFNYNENFSNLLTSTHDQILFQDLRDTLLEFPNGKLLVVNLTSWQTIEYFSLLGFKYVSGNYFGSEINKLPQIDTKKINKLISIKD